MSKSYSLGCNKCRIKKECGELPQDLSCEDVQRIVGYDPDKPYCKYTNGCVVCGIELCEGRKE